MSAMLSLRFLEDLAAVYTALRPRTLSPAFLSDLEKVYTTLPTASDADLLFLANRFDKWRRVTQEFVRTRLDKLDKDDPLLCPISLFRTMDSGWLETAHTRTLAWLLHPEREHGFDHALLAALLERLAGRDHFDRFQVTRVVGEHFLDGSAGEGRLDVLAEGEWESMSERVRWTLVIEAKVNAWESEGQLDKYDDWLDLRAAGRVPYRVFLTPDGRAPETGCEEWRALSFLELVKTFRKVYGELRHAPGFHFLRFYLAGVLQDVCGFPRNIGEDAADPYAVASYLKTVHESHSEGANHDAAR